MEQRIPGELPFPSVHSRWPNTVYRKKLLHMESSADKFSRLARLAHDFVFAAETYGKIIISELGLPGPSLPLC